MVHGIQAWSQLNKYSKNSFWVDSLQAWCLLDYVAVLDGKALPSAAGLSPPGAVQCHGSLPHGKMSSGLTMRHELHRCVAQWRGETVIENYVKYHTWRVGCDKKDNSESHKEFAKRFDGSTGYLTYGSWIDGFTGPDTALFEGGHKLVRSVSALIRHTGDIVVASGGTLKVYRALLMAAGMTTAVKIDDSRVECKPGQHGMNALMKRHCDSLLDFPFLHAAGDEATIKMLVDAWREFRDWMDLTEVVMMDPSVFEMVSLRLHFHLDLVFGPSIFRCDSLVQMLMQGLNQSPTRIVSLLNAICV